MNDTLTLEQFLNERYINIIGDRPELIAKKEQFKDQVWKILQLSYKPIGGIKGSGFGSANDMVKSIPFWKLIRKENRIVAVALYKDKGGRKLVATGTDGSTTGKEAMRDLVKNDLKRAFGEKSKAALGSTLKQYGWNGVEPFLYKPRDAAKLLRKELTPVKGIPISDLPSDAGVTLKKYPMLIDYGYIRDIAGEPTFKVLMGTPGMRIT